MAATTPALWTPFRYWRGVPVPICVLLFAFLWWPSAGRSEPYTEFASSPRLLVAEGFASRSFDDVVWEDEVSAGASTEFRLHFSDIDASVGFSVRIRNIDNVIVDTLNFATSRVSFWSNIYRGNYALIQVVGSESVLAGRRLFRIDKVLVERRAPKVQSVLDPPDFEEVAAIRDNKILQAARSVAKLSFVAEVGGVPEGQTCTGFMVSGDVMITNAHCIASQKDCDTAVAIFGYEYDANFRLRKGSQYRCETFIDGSTSSLDVSAIRLQDSPGSSDKWGHLLVKSATLESTQSVIIPQHPSGAPKKIVRKSCKVLILQASNKTGALVDFSHSCDTETGSSGAPVLDTEMAVVGVHHLGFDMVDQRWRFQNRAVNSQSVAGFTNRVLGR